jgi:hypothetical protein
MLFVVLEPLNEGFIQRDVVQPGRLLRAVGVIPGNELRIVHGHHPAIWGAVKPRV